MGTSGPTQRSTDEWKRVAEAIVRRREQRGWTQADVAARGGLSLDRVQAFEAGRGENYRARTVISLTRGLEWSINSVDKILKGGAPAPIEELRGEQLLLEAIWIICDAAATRSRRAIVEMKQRLWPAIDSRLEELHLTRKQVAWRADLDPMNVLEGHLSRRGMEKLVEYIAAAIQWTPGSVFAVLGGGQPEPVSYPVLHPSELDGVVVPMPPPPYPMAGGFGAVEYERGLAMGRRQPVVEVDEATFDEILSQAVIRPRADDAPGRDPSQDAIGPGEVLHGETMAIARSGLPQDSQDFLVQFIARRRRRFNAETATELQQLIAAMRASSLGKRSA